MRDHLISDFLKVEDFKNIKLKKHTEYEKNFVKKHKKMLFFSVFLMIISFMYVVFDIENLVVDGMSMLNS